MADSRSKKNGVEWPDEPLTDEFIAAARKQLTDNRTLNKLKAINEGESGYHIDSPAALARALSRLLGKPIGDKHVSNLLGPVRDGSKWDRPATSVLVQPVQSLLRMPRTVQMRVVEARVDVVRELLEMDDDLFEKIAAAIRERRARK